MEWDRDEAAEEAVAQAGLAESRSTWGADAAATTAAEEDDGHSFDLDALLELSGDSELSDDSDDGAAVASAPTVESLSCVTAHTTLLLPFSFWPTEDCETPSQLASSLLARTVRGDDGHSVALWEPGTLSPEAAELSPHFRQLLGHNESTRGPLRRLQLTAAARAHLFGSARLSGVQPCEWRMVRLIIFPHGAVLSVQIAWTLRPWTLADLRAAVYVAKFRTIKVGVARGWTFAQHAPPADERAAVSSLGLKLYAALYGGSGVSLSAVANWLVKMPWEPSEAPTRRVSRFDYCQHHTFARVRRRPRGLEQLLFHLRKAHGPRDERPMPASSYAQRFMTDQRIELSADCVVSCSREGVVELEWGPDAEAGERRREQFDGILLDLSTHCLSERVTLERLAYLAALQAQQVLAPSDVSVGSVAEREAARLAHAKLNSMLIRYRTSMASDDCGGSVDSRRFLKALRHVHHTAAFKETLLQQLEDAQYILDCQWKEERSASLTVDRKWMLRKEQLALQRKAMRERPKLIFDLLFFAFVAVTAPFILVPTMWGSNQSDLPREVAWNSLVIAAGVISAIFLALFVLLYIFGQRAIRVRTVAQQAHVALGEQQLVLQKQLPDSNE